MSFNIIIHPAYIFIKRKFVIYKDAVIRPCSCQKVGFLRPFIKKKQYASGMRLIYEYHQVGIDIEAGVYS